jgi:hypothetical protein
VPRPTQSRAMPPKACAQRVAAGVVFPMPISPTNNRSARGSTAPPLR